ncbi:DUF222 domain-containing protein, partial [Qaidamihabitans albus]|uniref:DUF222 domain-containing protein n=1 Tax=Qaidamihabitans albus TaxID=2795733 RepID=UPI0018F13FE4
MSGSLTRIFGGCPGAVPAPARAESQRHLLELATQATPDEVRAAGRRLRGYWDAQGGPPAGEDLAAPAREFRCRHKRNGDLEFSGHLDAETGATLEGLFTALVKTPASGRGRPSRSAQHPGPPRRCPGRDHRMRCPRRGHQRP